MPQDASELWSKFEKAKAKRGLWESHWDECYNYALPRRQSQFTPMGSKIHGHLYDATAADAVDQLAAALLSQLTPPWTSWFNISARDDNKDHHLDQITKLLQSHFDLSNFAVEIHQCYLDLIVGGTACLLLEENKLGDPSAFRFTAIPLSDCIVEEDSYGRLETTYRHRQLKASAILQSYPQAKLSERLSSKLAQQDDPTYTVVEAVWPQDYCYHYQVIIRSDDSDGQYHSLLDGRFETNPFINCRWVKAPGETYGRSPIMKALPDIKTANKVVELVLKNASIAVTGIWQAEDDGVLNPANIRLTPGTIIPKAVGSKGLVPLESPGRFDVSQLVLGDLRKRIRHALLVDRLSAPESPRMTATEVLERSREMARILGATFGRLQSELLTPLIHRGLAILKRRGEIKAQDIGDTPIIFQYHSIAGQAKMRDEAQNALVWLDTAKSLAQNPIINSRAVLNWLAGILNLPDDLVQSALIDAPNSGANTIKDQVSTTQQAVSTKSTLTHVQ